MSDSATVQKSKDEMDRIASAKTPFIMRKADYLVSGYSGYVMREKTSHIPLTRDQAFFVLKNPSVNGPKVAQFYAATNGMQDQVVADAWADLMAKEAQPPKAPAPEKTEEVKRGPGRPPKTVAEEA